jgi:hypothetical protein
MCIYIHTYICIKRNNPMKNDYKSSCGVEHEYNSALSYRSITYATYYMYVTYTSQRNDKGEQGDMYIASRDQQRGVTN